ncbi:MAG: hypothetical protein KAI89_03395 [Emcibacter sp.]|nr:hypothetical protein [Emcibacter sp.]
MGSSEKESSIFASRENVIVLVSFWIIIEIIIPFALQTVSLGEMLIGTDPFLRLVRVEDLLTSGDWYNSIISEIDAPYGSELHWTRPLDVLIIVVAAPLMLFVDMPTAVYIAGSIISPLLELGFFFAFLWCIFPIAKGDAARITVIAIFTQASLVGNFHLGRADHHSLLALLFVLAIGMFIRLLINNDHKTYASKAGVIAGLGVWVSIEFIYCIAAFSVFTAILWVVQGRQWARPNMDFFIGLAGMILLAFLWEVTPESYLGIVYDSISIVYVTLFILIATFWIFISLFSAKIPNKIFVRFCIGVAGASITLFILLLVGPDFLSGPMTAVDPRIIPIWLNTVEEMQPLSPTTLKGASEFIAHMGFAFVIIPLAFYIYYQRRYYHKLVWIFAIYNAVILAVIGILHIRFLLYPQIFFLILLAGIVHIFLDRIERFAPQHKKSPYRLYVFAGMIIIPLTITFLPMLSIDLYTNGVSRQTAEKEKCPLKDMALFLKNRSKGEKYTIEAFMDHGPALIYYSRHNVIGAPYHRSGLGIFDSHMMLNTTDEAESFDMAEKRGITHYLVCNKGFEALFFKNTENPDDTLYERLSRGDNIKGLFPVELPALLSESFKLYEFNKD